jgi:hypothetical protein
MAANDVNALLRASKKHAKTYGSVAEEASLKNPHVEGERELVLAP